ncbi:MAG: hypothetical protein PUC23_02775 [bacterium]|nr:hypothetical protein [bacterium]
MRKDFFKKQYKNILIGIFVVALIAMVVGISYAAYTFSGTGTKENVITTGEIVVNFNETNNISLVGRYSETDVQGLANTDPNSTLEFSVSSNIVGEATVNYAVGLVEINEGVTLTQNYIKIYMTKNGVVANGFSENKGNFISSYKNKSIEGYLESHVIAQDSLTGVQTNNYVVKAWIAEDYDLPITDISNNTTHSNQTTSETFSFKIKVVATDSNLTVKEPLKCDSMLVDNSGANAPELPTNAIAVCYNSEKDIWLKADTTNTNSDYQWYSYSGKTWANAVTVTETNRDTYLNASVGTEISMDDINTMWVWIPRFSATGDTANYNGGTQSAPGAFNITFVDNTTTAHDSFTFGTQNLNGFWVGKFEPSHKTLSEQTDYDLLACTNETCENAKGIEVLPNKVSLRRNNVSNFFYASRSMEQNGNPYGLVSSEVDTHMMKNNEWAAVSYLTYSLYGRCETLTNCKDIGINNNGETENYSNITGYGAPAGSDMSAENGAYNTTLGMDASTTGNIYGIYDMSGGAFESVMGVYKPATLDGITDRSGFSSSIRNAQFDLLPDAKYYNVYTTSEAYDNAALQHAVNETNGWYGDLVGFVSPDYPWFGRSAYFDNGSLAGVFTAYYGSGGCGWSDSNGSFRPALVK